jgi:glutathione S-transferase
LYSFRRCPYAIRARLALGAADIAYEHREVVLRDKPPSLRALSPKATVPVLLLPNQTVLDESLDIMYWALAQNDPLGWLITGPAQQAEEWVSRNDCEFKPLLDRYKYAGRYPEKTLEGHRAEAMHRWLLPLEQQLSKSGHVAGNQSSLADAALFPFIRQFEGVAPPWFRAQALPAIHQWLDQWLHSALFEQVMVKHGPWQE